MNSSVKNHQDTKTRRKKRLYLSSCLRAFVVLEILFAALGFLYSAITPIYEAPDEVWHDAYVRWVAGGNGLPPLDEDRSGAYQEAAQPPLYYLAAAAVRRLLPDDDLPSLMWHNPFFGYQAGGTVNDNKNMLIHTDRERFPWTGAARAIHGTRLVSLFFGLVTVAATGLLAWEAVGDRGGSAISLSAAALVVLTPQFLFISGIVSNDSASAATATFSLWAAARVLRRGVTPRRALLLGLMTGLAALTKTSALLLFPLALAALLLAPQGTAPQKAAGALLMLGCATAVGGWWYGHNALLYGDPLGISRHVQTPWGRQTPASLITLLGEMPRLYRSFWGAFGWGHVEYPAWLYGALGGLVVMSLVGWYRALRRPVSVHRGILLLAAGWLVLIFLALLQWMRQVEAPHGRLLFPAIGAWALLVAVGWEGLAQGRPRSGLLAAVYGGLLLLNVLTPPLVIRPAFALPRLLKPDAAARTVGGWELVYGGKIQLMGAEPKQRSVAPGGVLTVRACWEALTPVEKDYTVFVQLVGEGDTRIGERHTYPGLGRFPTSLWPVGQAFCDDYRVRVAPWATVPELYDGLIGLYDGDPSSPLLPVVGKDGRPLALPVAFQVRVAPEWPLKVSPAHPLDYRLGDAVGLIGYDLSGTVAAGGTITVTLYWQADGVPPGDYRVFVHLLDGRGEIVTQHDGPPRWGRYPTTVWQKGDVVPDEHLLAILTPAQGPFSLAVGMYRADTLERLPVVGPTGAVPDGRILLEVR